jgi:hypothetical protein
MGLFTRLLHREDGAGETAVAEPPACLHTALLPRWESVEDMGKDDRATGYHCDACGRDFTPAEADQLRASEGERLRLTTESHE